MVGIQKEVRTLNQEVLSSEEQDFLINYFQYKELHFMRSLKRIGMLLAFICIGFTANSDLLGPYIQTNTPACPSDMSQIVVYSNDWKVVTLRLKALDGSNAEYTIQTRGYANQAPYAYFLTKGQYRVIEMTEGYTTASNYGNISIGTTVDFTSNGYISFYAY